MHRFTLLAASAVLAIACPIVALADDDEVVASPMGIQESVSSTTFDLGIDVRGVAHEPAAVKAFILGLGPDAAAAIMGACETFMDFPVTAQSPETRAFCSNATG
jgi:hypothetical protein